MDGVGDGGRINQKRRTHAALVEATRSLIRSGGEVTMPKVADAALVSEATAYRYFPDLFSLLREAIVGLWPTPAEAMEPVAASTDPLERVAFATELFLRGVLAFLGATRSMLAVTVTRPETAARRSGIQFGLIDEALRPVAATLGRSDPARFEQLQRDLAVIVSAEALLCLLDLCHLDPDAAVRSVVQTATTVTAAALAAAP